jgi:hypothetical protein
MDVLVAAATMDSEETLAATAPNSPKAATIAPMEIASLAESKRHGRRKNLKERNAAAAAAQQLHAAAQMAW